MVKRETQIVGNQYRNVLSCILRSLIYSGYLLPLYMKVAINSKHWKED